MAKQFPSEILTLTVPINALSDEGIMAIGDYLYNAGLPNTFPKGWDWAWKITGKGTYVGTLPKRIAKYMYEKHGRKLTPEQMARLGDIGNAHCEKNGTYHIRFSQQIKWRDGDFADSGSCIMRDDGCHAGARQMLMEHGAYALQFFHTPEGGIPGLGRAFVIPHPTEPDSFITYNAYGLQLIVAARLLAHFWSCSYRTVDKFTNRGSSSGELYINGAKGYILADSAVLNNLPLNSNGDYYVDLNWKDIIPKRLACAHCGNRVSETSAIYPHGETQPWCERCYREQFVRCECCNHDLNRYNALTVMVDGVAQQWCASCRDAHTFRCTHCRVAVHNNNRVEACGHPFCSVCAAEQREVRVFANCPHCSTRFPVRLGANVGGNRVCSACASSAVDCWDCGRLFFPQEVSTFEGLRLCQSCVDVRVRSEEADIEEESSYEEEEVEDVA